jgi:hypothetical protein
MSELVVTVLDDHFALGRLPADAEVPAWVTHAAAFLTVSRTPTELSIVADERAMPAEVDAQRGYRALRVEGPLPLELVGVLATLATPLAAAGVPIFPIATYDTDYLFVPGVELERAVTALVAAGHRVLEPSEPGRGP